MGRFSHAKKIGVIGNFLKNRFGEGK